jgi:tRNA1(Val) A37 N6-methylase TrmN6
LATIAKICRSYRVKDPEEIYVLDKRVRLLQPAEGFRTSLDSVMLAAACPAGDGDHILDLGCGVGGAGFCVLQRVPDTKLTGVEIQADHVELANANIPLNHMQGRAHFVCMDMRNYSSDPFDHVICNPPYLDAGTHTRSPFLQKATAHGHSDEDISVKDWIDCGFDHLKSGGSFTIIHRADQTDKIIQGFGKRFGAVEIISLWPRQGDAAKRVIIRALKDRRTPALVHPGITLHKKDGGYTDEAEKILRGGAAIT